MEHEIPYKNVKQAVWNRRRRLENFEKAKAVTKPIIALSIVSQLIQIKH